MASKQNNGIRPPRYWAAPRRAVTVMAQARAELEQLRQRRLMREALEARQRNYQRLRSGEKQAEAEPPDAMENRPSHPPHRD